MTRIIVSEQYLTSLSKELNEAIKRLNDMDSNLQKSLRNIVWETKNRTNIESMYIEHQNRFKTTASHMKELADFVDKAKQKFLEEDQKTNSFISGFNLKAPIDGPGSIFGTATGMAAVAGTSIKVMKGYNIKYQLDRKNPRVLFQEGRKSPIKKYDISYIESQIKRGTASPKMMEIADHVAMTNMGGGIKTALKDKFGWASIAIDSTMDTINNVKSGASSDKIGGDIIGDVVVGAATTVAATALTVALLPATAPVLAVAGVGLGISVGMTYLTEGVKFNLDMDHDGKDDSIKDVVKYGAKKAWSTVASWF